MSMDFSGQRSGATDGLRKNRPLLGIARIRQVDYRQGCELCSTGRCSLITLRHVFRAGAHLPGKLLH